MALITLEPPREGFGADRFLIRNGARERNAVAIALRPFIQELPERLVDPAQFPMPGRRGPSRVKPSFPTPISNRETTEEIRLSEGGVAPLLGGEQALPCTASQVRSWTFTQTVATGNESLVVTLPLPWPFKINHITATTRSAPLDNNSHLRIWVAPGTGNNGVISPGRIPVLVNALEVAGSLDPITTPKHLYPAYPVSQPNWHIQLIAENSTGGTLIYQTHIEIERLG